MSPKALVRELRSALASLAGTGAVSSSEGARARFVALAGRARSLGLVELGAELDLLSAELERRGAMAYEPSIALAGRVLSIHDRTEALASAIALWDVESAFAEGGAA
jgi:hypothetical protein